MEIPWFFVLVTIILCFLIKSLTQYYTTTSNTNPKLPPSPPFIPIITTLQWMRKTVSDFEPALRYLRSIHGPIFSLWILRKRLIFIASSDLAHKALITHGSTFADRPPAPIASLILTDNQHNINTAGYGPLWRLLRRNLTSEILHPSRVKSYSHARKWVLQTLKAKLKQDSESGRSVIVMEHFLSAMFCLLILMCFGDKLDHEIIRDVERVQRDLSVHITEFSVLDFFPRLGRILFREAWRQLHKVRTNQREVLLPLIQTRREKMQRAKKEEEVVAYVDTLLNITLPNEGGRKLKDQEIIGLCSEFLNAGADTTSTALQWIMANLVKHQDIQLKLLAEIKRAAVNTSEDVEIKEGDLHKIPYLKAVVLEGLRRHPPAHFLLPHNVTEDVQLGEYVVPKDSNVNFMAAEIGWDPNVWNDPMGFKPERFLNGEEVFDITGSREIKMMPFGAGRRICPGIGLALLHLEYFVANLVKEFEWTAEEGDDVDFSEKQEFTVIMKNPLRAHTIPRQT